MIFIILLNLLDKEHMGYINSLVYKIINKETRIIYAAKKIKEINSSVGVNL